MLFPLRHAPKSQLSTDVKISSHRTDFIFRLIFEPCVIHSIILEFIPNYVGVHLLFASYQELDWNSFLNLLLFCSHTSGIVPIHFLIKNVAILSFILLAILWFWHLISASNYLVSSILLSIFFKGAETFKIALWSMPKRSQLSQNMSQIIQRGLS